MAAAPAAAVGQGRTALVLTGGGARAAYQVGVLRAIAQLLPRGAPTPFQIVCGTSAGAINAVAIAADAGDFRRAVRRLVTVWKNFHAGHVYRADLRGIAACGSRWLLALLLGGLGKRNPVSLLDNAPLAQLLRRRVDFEGVRRSLEAGTLTALAVTASGYSSGHSIAFFEAAAGVQGWRRARRIGVPARIGLEHLMASSALPFIFAPTAIGHEYFGDGSMRQIAPISPALHLGAERIIVISVSRPADNGHDALRNAGCPSLAQIAGHALNSIFIDALDADLERLERINRTVAKIAPAVRAAQGMDLKHIDCLVLSPSEALDRIAVRHLRSLPWPVRFFLRGIGAMRRSGSNLASYVLFERPFCRALIGLGYRDTLARRAEVLAFLGMVPAGVVVGVEPAAKAAPPLAERRAA